MRRAMLTWVLVFAFTYTASAQQERQLTETQWDQYSQQRLTVLLLTPEAVPEPEVFAQPRSLFEWRVHQGLMPLRESAFLQMVGLEEMSHRVYRRQKKAKRLRRIGHAEIDRFDRKLIGRVNRHKRKRWWVADLHQSQIKITTDTQGLGFNAAVVG